MALIVPGMQATPEQIAGRVKFGQGLREQAASTAPVQGSGPLQALAHALMGGMGGYGEYSAEQDRLQEQQRNASMVANLTEGGKTPTYADLMGLSTDPWTPPAALTLGAEMLKGDTEKWAVNPKTGQYYNQRTGEVKPMVPGQSQLALDDLAKIQDEYQKSYGVKEWAMAAPILDSMRASITNPSAISDLQFVNGVAKVLDPTSVVRTEEGRQVLQSQSIDSQTLGILNRILSGKQALGYDLRVEMYKLARERGAEYFEQAKGAHDYWSKQGASYGMRPDQMLGLDPLAAAEAPANPDEYGTGGKPR